jgi:hypothetical protein
LAALNKEKNMDNIVQNVTTDAKAVVDQAATDVAAVVQPVVADVTTTVDNVVAPVVADVEKQSFFAMIIAKIKALFKII